MADKKNVYEILGVTQESSDREITKAYRKKALACHPDKNPDDPRAAAIFDELTKAFEVLSDPKARAALDASLKAKERQRLRTQALDAKRKKFKLDLEQQENAARDATESKEAAEKRLKSEIERLREEGSQLLKDQQEIMRTQTKEKQQTSYPVYYDHTPKLKVKWKSKKNDERNGGYTTEILTKLFEKYGKITHVILSSKKKGSAIIEFTNVKDAKMALMNEFGNTDNPLNISWLDNTAATTQPSTDNSTNNTDPPVTTYQSTVSDRDYESITLMRLRQAQERKRLIEEMQNEDEND